MQDNYDIDSAPTPDDSEADAAGEVIKRRRFDIGSRATIMMGLTLGAVASAAVFLPGYGSFTVSLV